MPNELTVPQTFEEKMRTRIRESIGELMPDDELSKLVHRGVEDVFFKEVTVKDPWGHVLSPRPGMIYDMVKELLTPRVEAVIREYVKEHPDEVRLAIENVLATGVGTAIVKGFAALFEESLVNLRSDVEGRLEGIMARR